MKSLLLLRHAKAVQDGKDGSGDFGRQLTGRGRKDAARIGAWLHENGIVPDFVLCSSSARTRETWGMVAQELGGEPKVEFLKQLYLASAKTILTTAQMADDATRTLMMIGHNPGTEEAAGALARAPTDKDERDRLETLKNKFPTAALAILDFDTEHWREIRTQSAALRVFIRPKNLD